MKRSLLLVLALAAASAHLDASTPSVPRDCADLQREIAGKIEANGVRSYSLQIVRADQATSGTIVGHCDGGSRKIAYRRIELPAAALSQARPADGGGE